MAERLALPTSDHGVAGSNPAGGEILPEPKQRFIEQSLSCSPFHRLEMTEILLKGRKTLTHPSIHYKRHNNLKLKIQITENTNRLPILGSVKFFLFMHRSFHFHIYGTQTQLLFLHFFSIYNFHTAINID